MSVGCEGEGGAKLFFLNNGDPGACLLQGVSWVDDGQVSHTNWAGTRTNTAIDYLRQVRRSSVSAGVRPRSEAMAK
jgi:hypothetical protein